MSQPGGGNRGFRGGGRGAPRGGSDNRGRGGGPGRGGFPGGDRGGRGGAPSRGGPPASAPQQQFPGADRGGRGRGASRGVVSRGGAPASTSAPLPPTGPSVVQPTPTTVSIAPDVISDCLKRPSYATRGRQITVDTNYFPTKIPEGNIYQYHVEFVPSVGSKALKMELFRKVQTLSEFLEASNQKRGVYDSDNLFFSTTDLGESLQLQLPDGRKTYTIRLKRTATINPEILQEYVQGQRARGDGVSAVLAACNVALRMGLMEKFSLYNRNSFFIREAENKTFWDRKYAGLEMVRGFFQSIRPVVGRMIINVDVSTGVVVQGGSMIELALSFFKQRVDNVQFLANLRPFDKTALERYLRGVKFVTHDDPNARPGAVKALTRESAEGYMFEKDGQRISVAQHNRAKGTPLRFPRLPCVEKIGPSRAVYAMEQCTIRPQLLPRQVEPDQIKDVLDFSTMRPQIRLQKIREGFQFLEYSQNPYLRDFGISIDPNPLRVHARVLPAPELQYAGNKFTRPQNGTWRSEKFIAPKEVKGWILINMSGRQMNLQQIAMDLKGSCVAAGMRWTNSNPIVEERNPLAENVKQVIEQAIAEHKRKLGEVNLVIIIIPDDGKDVYYKVKHAGDVKLGIPTQCLKASKCMKGGRDYYNNLSLKVNVKLGGTNVVLKSTEAKFLTQQNVLLLGADVMHSRAMGDEGLGRPSFAALTGNIDQAGCRYVGVGRAQKTRQEMIAELDKMVLDIIAEYKKAGLVKKPFTSVLYFRDGVAENQFSTVLAQEIPKIRDACKRAGAGGVKITCVIVGKRHHLRMFPVDDASQDRTGNAPPGTVIDSIITSPLDFDFYLQPHAGLLGTSRPVHCTVLIDENLFTPDDLQQLTFNLCHVYARSTRSVSLPAPVYYAHLVCARANHRFEPGSGFSLDAPAQRTLRSDEAERRLQEFINNFQPLHPTTQSLMYFQ